MRLISDALENTRDACLLDELICRRPVLADLVPSPRRALRSDALVECPGFRLDSLLDDNR